MVRFENLKLTSREFLLAITFAIMGFLLSSKEFILWLNQNNPLTGFLIYYLILYVAVFFLARLGLVAAGFKIEKPMQYIGVLFIITAFFITINLTSPLVNITTNGSAQGISDIYFMSEDGAVWYFWGGLTSDTGILRILTYVISPFILALFGGLLIEKKIQILN